MKLYDVIDTFEKYTDAQVFTYITDKRELQQDNLSLVDRHRWIRYLAADVIDCKPMEEGEYNETVNSNQNPYLDFGDYYDYTGARVLVVTVDPGEYGI